MRSSSLMPKLAVYDTALSLNCCGDFLPCRNLLVGPYSGSVVAAGSVSRDDCCFAYDEGAGDTRSLIVVNYELSAIVLQYSRLRQLQSSPTLAELGCAPIVIHAIPR